MSRTTTFAGLAGGLLLGATLGWIARPAQPQAPCPPSPDCPASSLEGRGASPLPPPAAPIAPAPTTEPGSTSSRLPELPELVVPEKKGGRATTADLAATITEHPTWSSEWPADLAPDGFEERAASDLKDCRGEFTFLGTDCEEPPCFAVFTGPVGAGDEDISAWLESCTAWSATYGSTSDRWTRCSRHLKCSSGEEVSLVAIASQRSLDLLAEQGFAQMDLKALQQQRCDDATVMFGCP